MLPIDFVINNNKHHSDEIETMEIIAVDEGIAWGRSVFRNILGAPSVSKCKFIARVFSPNGSHDAASHGFDKHLTIPIEELSGEDRRRAQKALDWLHQGAIEVGWKQTGKGAHWYSYKYERPYPFDINHFVSKAVDLSNKGHVNEALETFNLVIQYWPKDDVAYGWRGLMLSSMKRYEDALAAINQAIELGRANNKEENVRMYCSEKETILKHIKS